MAQTKYVAFNFSDAGKTLSWTGGAGVQYSFDNKTWTDATSPITVTGKTVLLRAKNGTTPMYGFTDDDVDGGVSVSGHLGALIDYEAADLDYVTVSDYQFSSVTGTAPSYIVSGLFSGCHRFKYERLSFPKTNTVGKWCYAGMFNDKLVYTTTEPYTSIILCSLISLPAKMIGEGSYFDMFNSCSALIAPLVSVLPATALKSYCYANMFNSCLNMASLPTIQCAWLAPYCCYRMFHGCNGIVKTGDFEIPALWAGEVIGTDGAVIQAEAEHCFEGMFMNCTALTTISSMTMLQLKSLSKYCCYKMFSGCHKLNSGAKYVTGSMCITYLPEGCYSNMFYNCSSLTEGQIFATKMYSVTYSAATSTDQGPLALMFAGCSKLSNLYIAIEEGIKDTDWSSHASSYNYSTYDMVTNNIAAHTALYIDNLSISSKSNSDWFDLRLGDTPASRYGTLSYIN